MLAAVVAAVLSIDSPAAMAAEQNVTICGIQSDSGNEFQCIRIPIDSTNCIETEVSGAEGTVIAGVAIGRGLCKTVKELEKGLSV